MSMLQQQVVGKLLRPGVRLKVPPFIPSGMLGLASVLQGPWSFRNTGSGRKLQVQNLVVGPMPNTSSFHLTLKRVWGKWHRAAGAVLWGFSLTIASLPFGLGSLKAGTCYL